MKTSMSLRHIVRQGHWGASNLTAQFVFFKIRQTAIDRIHSFAKLARALVNLQIFEGLKSSLAIVLTNLRRRRVPWLGGATLCNLVAHVTFVTLSLDLRRLKNIGICWRLQIMFAKRWHWKLAGLRRSEMLSFGRTG